MKMIIKKIAQGLGIAAALVFAVFIAMATPCQTPMAVEESGLWYKEVTSVTDVGLFDGWINGKPQAEVVLKERGAWRDAVITITREGKLMKVITARQIAHYPNWEVVE